MTHNEMKDELFNLVVYMLTSARGLYDEPADYGIFRLLDASGRLLEIMESSGMNDPFLSQLKQAVDEEREGNMDSERQREHLDKLVLEIAAHL